jgi:hypothetical protein
MANQYNHVYRDLALAIGPGALAAFQQAMEDDWDVGSMKELTGSIAEASDRTTSSTSTSLVAVTAGAKVFTLDVAMSNPWTNGMPMFVRYTGDPQNVWMIGKLSADSDGTTINVNIVQSEGGPGSFDDWEIASIFYYMAPPAALPLGTGDGGLGTEIATAGGRAVGRLNLEVRQHIRILSVLSAAPGGALAGDTHLVGQAPSGWGGPVLDDVARYNGATWDVVPTDISTHLYDEQLKTSYEYAGIVTVNSISNLSKWSFVDGYSIMTKISATFGGGGAFVGLESHGTMISVDATGGVTTANFNPAGTVPAGLEVIVFKSDASGNAVDLTPFAGTINGVASISLTSQYDMARVVSDGTNNWMAWLS